MELDSYYRITTGRMEQLAFCSVVKYNYENSSITYIPLSSFDPVFRQFLPIHNLALHFVSSIYVSLVHPSPLDA